MTSLLLFFLALLKVLVLCGLGPGIAIAFFVEKFRIVEVGIEQVSGQAVSHNSELSPLSDGNQPARNAVWRVA